MTVPAGSWELLHHLQAGLEQIPAHLHASPGPCGSLQEGSLSPPSSPAQRLVPEPGQALQHCGVRQRAGRRPSPRLGEPCRCPSCEHRAAPTLRSASLS